MARRYDEDDNDDDDRDDDDYDERPRKKKKGGLSDEEKQMAMFCHLGMFIGGFIIPLIIWMMKKDQSRFVAWHGKEALNFSISMYIWAFALFFLTCGIGLFIYMPFTIYWCIMAGLAANRGERYEYPMTIRFIS